ncbi:terminase small subunit [Mesorhizobium marinum]|uniref:Terminase small subunit n=1 Tax=Mesorhizobium marinum TaxID=3228790 RepID=A0ABV3QZB8_9HYPH
MSIAVDELNDRARRFAAEYLIDFTVSRAAQRAGVSRRIATEYMNDPRVQALIQDGKFKHTEAVNASVAMVLGRLVQIATANMDEALRALEPTDDQTRSLSERLSGLPDHVRYSVKSVELTKYGPRLTMHDKIAALANLGRYFGMFTDKVEVAGRDGTPFHPITETMTLQEAAEAYRLTIEG